MVKKYRKEIENEVRKFNVFSGRPKRRDEEIMLLK